jgi:hypothetical protein
VSEQLYTLVAALGMSLSTLDDRSSDDYAPVSSVYRGQVPSGTFTIKVRAQALLKVMATDTDDALSKAPIGVVWLVFDEAGNCCMDELPAPRDRMLPAGEP